MHISGIIILSPLLDREFNSKVHSLSKMELVFKAFQVEIAHFPWIAIQIYTLTRTERDASFLHFCCHQVLINCIYSLNMQFKYVVHLSTEVSAYIFLITWSYNILRILALFYLSCVLPMIFLLYCLSSVYSVFYHKNSLHFIVLFTSRKAFFQSKSINRVNRVTFIF